MVIIVQHSASYHVAVMFTSKEMSLYTSVAYPDLHDVIKLVSHFREVPRIIVCTDVEHGVRRFFCAALAKAGLKYEEIEPWDLKFHIW